jgi:hypothetical protein
MLRSILRLGAMLRRAKGDAKGDAKDHRQSMKIAQRTRITPQFRPRRLHGACIVRFT